jgi:beta-mannosidase
MEMHQRNNDANGKIMNYLSSTYLYPKNFDMLLYVSQLLQMDAIRYGVEHFRRFRGTCMGTIVWQLNDIWPTASWSSVDYYGRWKALHYAEKRMFAPILLSCEEHGEIDQKPHPNTQPRPIELSATFHVANETENKMDGTIVWGLMRSDSSIVKQGILEVHAEPYSGAWLDKIDFSDEDQLDVHLTYSLILGDEMCGADPHTVSTGSTLFCAPKHYHFANPHLAVSVNGDEVTVTADAFCKGVYIYTEDGNLQLSDNYFDMEKGSRTLKIVDSPVWTAEHDADLSTIKAVSVYDIDERQN